MRSVSRGGFATSENRRTASAKVYACRFAIHDSENTHSTILSGAGRFFRLNLNWKFEIPRNLSRSGGGGSFFFALRRRNGKAGDEAAVEDVEGVEEFIWEEDVEG